MAFAVSVFPFCRAVRRIPGGRTPADQLLDCATSVGANYRAVTRARSRAEFIARLGVVVEEVDETVFWLEFMQRVELGDVAVRASLREEARQLRAVFSASLRTARVNSKRRAKP